MLLIWRDAETGSGKERNAWIAMQCTVTHLPLSEFRRSKTKHTKNLTHISSLFYIYRKILFFSNSHIRNFLSFCFINKRVSFTTLPAFSFTANLWLSLVMANWYKTDRKHIDKVQYPLLFPCLISCVTQKCF